jgi:hypothetical protein
VSGRANDLAEPNNNMIAQQCGDCEDPAGRISGVLYKQHEEEDDEEAEPRRAIDTHLCFVLMEDAKLLIGYFDAAAAVPVAAAAPAPAAVLGPKAATMFEPQEKELRNVIIAPDEDHQFRSVRAV